MDEQGDASSTNVIVDAALVTGKALAAYRWDYDLAPDVLLAAVELRWTHGQWQGWHACGVCVREADAAALALRDGHDTRAQHAPAWLGAVFLWLELRRPGCALYWRIEWRPEAADMAVHGFTPETPATDYEQVATGLTLLRGFRVGHPPSDREKDRALVARATQLKRQNPGLTWPQIAARCGATEGELKHARRRMRGEL
jgi:hypothetical protein